ncbi:quaternary ammonium transporter [Oculatella sp. FACHB-28]|uniref:glycine betaine ABC transporter substrate-binding protein n=1 Tax=Cyanophyceae TaxID=3028117 RepID=UPI0016862587|nr:MULTISPECIES: glycine betaine ABC transporter substrate-binding protein [Cyanophyceae]MBD2056309.1 quaternary ammonium transporter [Oculatella sp. FACHB-28]MBD2071512.1 quaternary ammonium transporter [Leptolyngbya sp. FACHB-671]
MKIVRRLLTFLLIVVLTTAIAVACNSGGTGDNSAAPVRVGSKDFTEEFILGEMYALVLEDSGLQVERKFNLGGTPVAQSAIINDEIDLYPEYTGTALLTVLKLPVISDRQQVFDTVSSEYKEQFDLVWLDPAPMNNTQALAMTQEKAEQYGIRTISDLVGQAEQLTIVTTPEFQEREDGLPGLKRVYGEFDFKQLIPVDAGLRYEALVRGEADVVEAFGTDGQISAYNLVVLEDDKGLFPPYQVAPVVRQAALDANPEIQDALNALAPKLTDETMRRLNNEVDGNGREPAEVAQEFLVQEGFLNDQSS